MPQTVQPPTDEEFFVGYTTEEITEKAEEYASESSLVDSAYIWERPTGEMFLDVTYICDCAQNPVNMDLQTRYDMVVPHAVNEGDKIRLTYQYHLNHMNHR